MKATTKNRPVMVGWDMVASLASLISVLTLIPLQSLITTSKHTTTKIQDLRVIQLE